jgi:uncharacterized phage protein (TIGR02220 family)
MNHGREDKNPWTKWYWQDWASDDGLRACSLAAQGLWMRMLSIMARSKKKGFLLDGEKQMESKTLAKLNGESEATIDALLAELFSHGVPSKNDDGIIFNRRMVRESQISEIRSDVGRLGGRPKKQNESKMKAGVVENGKAKGKAPSASASVYASVIEFLNLKTGKAFSDKSKATISHIKARIAEGRTLDDFKYVIAVKASAWLNDPKMNAYLRPETLFGSKMESYLNEAMILSDVERDRLVGAAPERSDADRKRDADMKRRRDEIARNIHAKYDPLIETARGADLARLRTAANAELETELNAIEGGMQI